MEDVIARSPLSAV
jgi:hypothetical protein